jgi:hypothetical protein
MSDPSGFPIVDLFSNLEDEIASAKDASLALSLKSRTALQLAYSNGHLEGLKRAKTMLHETLIAFITPPREEGASPDADTVNDPAR